MGSAVHVRGDTSARAEPASAQVAQFTLPEAGVRAKRPPSNPAFRP
jgi:hypothetical protein